MDAFIITIALSNSNRIVSNRLFLSANDLPVPELPARLTWDRPRHSHTLAAPYVHFSRS